MSRAKAPAKPARTPLAQLISTMLARKSKDPTGAIRLRTRAGREIWVPVKTRIERESVRMGGSEPPYFTEWAVTTVFAEEDTADLAPRVFSELQGRLVDAGLWDGGAREFVMSRIQITEVNTRPAPYYNPQDLLDQAEEASVDRYNMVLWALERTDAKGLNLLEYGDSLYCVESVEVHPSVRGTSLGLHVLGRALTTIGRGSGSVALLNPTPLISEWDDTENPNARDADGAWNVGGMVRYYERMGFRSDARWQREKGVSMMVAPFCARSMPREYWGD